MERYEKRVRRYNVPHSLQIKKPGAHEHPKLGPRCNISLVLVCVVNHYTIIMACKNSFTCDDHYRLGIVSVKSLSVALLRFNQVAVYVIDDRYRNQLGEH